MKPTDEACKEFRRVYNNTHVSPEAQVRASLTASFAVQFSPVEEHAELVNQLRSIDEERLNNEPYSCEQLCKKAADALESVLAERDALKAELAAVTAERDAFEKAANDMHPMLRSLISRNDAAEIVRRAARAALEGVTEKSGAENE